MNSKYLECLTVYTSLPLSWSLSKLESDFFHSSILLPTGVRSLLDNELRGGGGDNGATFKN